MSPWTPARDKELLRLRDDEKLVFTAVARRMGISDKSAIGRYHRLKGRVFPCDYARGRGVPSARIFEPSHNYRDLQPSKAPFAPDSSVPRFANDDDHCDAALAGGGFPILARRSS